MSGSIPRSWPVPIAASTFRCSSRARSRSTAFTAPARSATAWAASTTSIRRRSVTDWSKPLLEGGLGPGSASQNLIHILQLAAEAYGFKLSTPFEQFPRKTQNLILYGPENGEKKRGGFLGVFAYLRRNMEDSSSPRATAIGCWTTCRPQPVRLAAASACARRAWR